MSESNGSNGVYTPCPTVDHAAKAAELLAPAPIYGAVGEARVRRAKVHATLALVERLDRLTGLLAGGRACRVRIAGAEGWPEPEDDGPTDATSTCPGCHAVTRDDTLAARDWKCPNCGGFVPAF